jgi:hypothetical protein
MRQLPIIDYFTYLLIEPQGEGGGDGAVVGARDGVTQFVGDEGQVVSHVREGVEQDTVLHVILLVGWLVRLFVCVFVCYFVCVREGGIWMRSLVFVGFKMGREKT